MCLPCYVPKVLQPRRSWADFKEVAAPPRALRTNVSIYLSSPSPAAVFLMEILSGTADGTPHTHQLRSSTDPQVMIWVFAVHFWYFYCPGYRGMYVQGVSSKSFKQNAAGAMVPPINQQKPQYPLLLAISTKLGPKIVIWSFLTKTILKGSRKKNGYFTARLIVKVDPPYGHLLGVWKTQVFFVHKHFLSPL